MRGTKYQIGTKEGSHGSPVVGGASKWNLESYGEVSSLYRYGCRVAKYWDLVMLTWNTEIWLCWLDPSTQLGCGEISLGFGMAIEALSESQWHRWHNGALLMVMGALLKLWRCFFFGCSGRCLCALISC